MDSAAWSLRSAMKRSPTNRHSATRWLGPFLFSRVAHRVADLGRWAKTMKPRLVSFIVVLLATSSLAGLNAAPQRVTPDVATQIVLKQYGLESEILRSFDRLEAESQRPDGRFEFLLTGAPA